MGPEFGLSPSFLSIILSQAAIVLIACSVLLVVVKDLYEVREVRVGLPGRRRRRENQLVLPGVCADRLRMFLTLFSVLLPAMYVFIGFCVLLVETGRIPPGKTEQAAQIRFTLSSWEYSFSFRLNEVYGLELIFHFIVVVIVALIFFWMTGVRRKTTKLRLEETPT